MCSSRDIFLSWVLTARFSPDGKIIATAAADCSVRLWSVETARMIVKLEGFRGWVRALSWTNDGSRLAAACNDSDVYASPPPPPPPLHHQPFSLRLYVCALS